MKLIHKSNLSTIQTIFVADKLEEDTVVVVTKHDQPGGEIFEEIRLHIHAFNRKSITFDYVLAGKIHYLTYNWKDFLLVEK